MDGSLPKDHRETIGMLARLGYLARALVFLVIGYFSFRTAFAGGEIMSQEDAIRQIVGTPFGSLLLALLVMALPSFALWRYLQAFFDADGYGTDAKGIATRIGRFASGCIYLFLTFFAGSLLFGLQSGSGGGGGSGLGGVLQGWSPVFGPWFTVPVGVVMLGVAFAHLKRAWTGEFLRFLQLPPAHARWMVRVCQVGLVARAMVFAAFAVLFYTSASRWSPESSPGLQSALQEISSWPFGSWLLSATGAGLMAFAFYCLLLSRYGHIRAPDLDPGEEMSKLRGHGA